jgi:hypothetical protein
MASISTEKRSLFILILVMTKQAIVHVMTNMSMKSDLFSVEIDAIESLSEKYGVKNIICYK